MLRLRLLRLAVVARVMALCRKVLLGIRARPIEVRLVRLGGLLVVVVVVVVVVDVSLGAQRLRLDLLAGRRRRRSARERKLRAQAADGLVQRAHGGVDLAGPARPRALLVLLVLLLAGRRGRFLLLAAADYAGTDASGLVEPVQDLAYAAVRHLQLAAYLAGPRALLGELDYQLPLVHGQRAPVDEGAAELIAPALAVPDHGARQRLLLLLDLVLLVLVVVEVLVGLVLVVLLLLVLVDCGRGGGRERRLPGAHRARQRVVLVADHRGSAVQVRLRRRHRRRLVLVVLMLLLVVVVVVVLLLLLVHLLVDGRRERALPACLCVHLLVSSGSFRELGEVWEFPGRD